jgi:heptosyltransferase-1
MTSKLPSSVLIVHLGSVGDVARALAVACTIKEQSPSTKIGWVISSRYRDLLRNHPAVDQVYSFNEKKFISELISVTSLIRKEQYEVCLDLQRILKSGVISLATGIKKRIGFNRRNSKEGNAFFQTGTIESQDENSLGKLSLYLSFLKNIGGVVPSTINFGLKGAPLPVGLELPKDFIVVILSSRWKTKDWPVEGYVEVINRLQDEFPLIKVVVIGSKGDEEKLSSLLSKVKKPSDVQSLIGKTLLGDIAPVLERAKLVFGPDSGPLHISSAVGVPYVCLFGPTSVLKVHPHQNTQNAIVSPIGCSGCYRKECPELGTICMRLISPNMVFHKIRSLLLDSVA